MLRIASLFCLLFTCVFTAHSQCDSLLVRYQTVQLDSESEEEEKYFTNVPKDSIEINFNDSFDDPPIEVEINGTKKYIYKATDHSLGYTGSMRFERPQSGDKIKISYNGLVAWVNYNDSFNMIYVWKFKCSLTIRHTNESLLYE